MIYGKTRLGNLDPQVKLKNLGVKFDSSISRVVLIILKKKAFYYLRNSKSQALHFPVRLKETVSCLWIPTVRLLEYILYWTRHTKKATARLKLGSKNFNQEKGEKRSHSERSSPVLT